MNISPISFGKLYIPGLKSNKEAMAKLFKNETDYNAAQDAFERINSLTGDEVVFLEMKPLNRDTVQLSVTDSAMVTTALMGEKTTFAKQEFNSQDAAMDGINKNNFRLFADKFEANYTNREENQKAADKRADSTILKYQLN